MEAKDFLDHILEKDVRYRYTALQALNHPWIVENSLPPDLNSHLNMDEELE